jgi:hypothetical protein
MEAQIEEEWRDVVGYDGEYEVSNLGRVRRLPKTIVDSCRGGKRRRFLKAKIIKRTISKTGYYTVALGKRNVKLHRVIAEAFIPNPEGKPYINHKSGVKTDNRICNIEWCTHAENLQHAAHVLGTMNLLHPMRKVVCVETGIVYDSLATAARDTGTAEQNIWHVCNGHWKTSGGYHWRYADGD